MRIIALIHICALTLYIWIAVFVLSKNNRAVLNISCALVVGCLAFWNFGAAFVRSAKTPEAAFIWQSVSSFGWIMLSSAFLFLVFVYTGIYKRLRKAELGLILIPLPALFIYKQFRGRLISDFILRGYGWNNIWGRSVWPVLFYVYYFLFISLGLILLIRFIKRENSLYKKKQAKIIFISVLLAMLLTTITDIVLPKMDLYVIPPLGAMHSLILAGGIVYAVTKYGFMSINPASAADDIVSSMSDSLVLVNYDGEIVKVNEAACEMLGYRKNELYGKHYESLFGGKGDLFKENHNFKNKRTFLKAKKGKNIPVTLSSTIVKGIDGGVFGVVFVAHDMRDIIRKTKQLKESYSQQAMLREKLIKNEKMAMIGRLADSVGHEIKAPLSSIRNTAFYLNRYGQVEDQDSRGFINILINESYKIENIVNSLLSFAYSKQIDCSKVEIKKALDKVLNSIKKDEKIDVIKKIASDADTIVADPAKFEELLNCLIKNSMQAIEGSGKIIIKTEKSISGKCIYVIDDGKGIDEKEINHIFKPLYTTKVNGIGLGLSIAKDIIEAHGWDFTIRSKKDRGTEFVIKKEESIIKRKVIGDA